MVMSFILHVRQDVYLKNLVSKLKKNPQRQKHWKFCLLIFFLSKTLVQYRIIGNFSESEIKRFNLNLG